MTGSLQMNTLEQMNTSCELVMGITVLSLFFTRETTMPKNNHRHWSLCSDCMSHEWKLNKCFVKWQRLNELNQILQSGCLARLHSKISAGAGVFPGVWHPRVCKNWDKSLNSLAGCVSAVDVLILLPMGTAGHLTASLFSCCGVLSLSQCTAPGWAKASLERGEHRPPHSRAL